VLKYLFTTSALIFSVLTSGCVSSGPSKLERALIDAKVKSAISKMYDCGYEKVDSVDDKKSDAYTIALGLSYACNKEYTDSVEAMEAGLDNDNQRRMFRNKCYTSQARAEKFLPIVLQYRNQEMKR
jgi:hypothetical protein